MKVINATKTDSSFVPSFVEDPNLILAAKGIMFYVLSTPGDLTVTLNDIVNSSSSGITAVRNAMLNLMEHGYVYYHVERNEKGRFNEGIYQLYEAPELNPYREEAQMKAKEKIQSKRLKSNRPS